MVLHHLLMINQRSIVLRNNLIDVVLISDQIVLILQEIDHGVTKMSSLYIFLKKIV